MVKEVTMIIQARMDSERLPGKTLRLLAGKPMLSHIIERLRQSRNSVGIVVATSTNPSNDGIESFCRELGVDCFRGDERDVLGRFYHAAKAYGCRHINRICGDNPFIDPTLIDEVTGMYDRMDIDYAGIEREPMGIGFQMFPIEWLEKAYQEGHEPYHREHVFPYMLEAGIKRYFYQYPEDLSRVRLTVDTEKDWKLAEKLYEILYHGRHDFYLPEIMNALRAHPELIEINRDVEQRKIHEIITNGEDTIMTYTYKTKGVCSSQIQFDVENGVVKKLDFANGCTGNLQGIGRLVEGMKVEDVIERLKGLQCGMKGTSCPDQLACALENYQERE